MAPYSSIAQATGPWTYDRPVIVLVGRWTGSMGEGMAVGLDATARAQVIGSPMAGLPGGIEDFPLQQLTGVAVQFPTYDLHHLDGTPRHHWAPPIIQTADNGNGKDELLDFALTMLNRLTQE